MDKYLIRVLVLSQLTIFLSKILQYKGPKQTTQNTNKKRGGKKGQLKCGGISIAS
jgi:hypothetical protein